MKTKLRLLAVALIAGGTMFAQPRLSIGVRVGGYGPGAYPPPSSAQYQSPWRRPVVTEGPRDVEPRYDNAYRGNDRDDHDRDRDRDNLSQNRGSQRRDNDDNRGYNHSDGFRR
jgi:hypothetical protein